MEGSLSFGNTVRQVRTSSLPAAVPTAQISSASIVHPVCHFRYQGVLQDASQAIVEHYGQNSGVLVLNLGPAWGKSNAYDLFQDNVIEIAFKEWESPPGLGICPLDVIFSVCHTASSWLAQNEKHVVVSAATGPTVVFS